MKLCAVAVTMCVMTLHDVLVPIRVVMVLDMVAYVATILLYEMVVALR